MVLWAIGAATAVDALNSFIQPPQIPLVSKQSVKSSEGTWDWAKVFFFDQILYVCQGKMVLIGIYSSAQQRTCNGRPATMGSLTAQGLTYI